MQGNLGHTANHRRRQEQILDKRQSGADEECVRDVLQRANEREQPEFPHHAGSHHKGS